MGSIKAPTRLDLEQITHLTRGIIMNLKALSATCLFSALSIGLLPIAAHAKSYAYGTELDIKEILSLSEDAMPTCGVVNAHMVYLDSWGQRQALDYRKLASNCSQEG